MKLSYHCHTSDEGTRNTGRRTRPFLPRQRQAGDGGERLAHADIERDEAEPEVVDPQRPGDLVRL
jgi:hypothetical protein